MLFSISKLYETETCNRQTVRNYVETRPPYIHVCFESRVMRVLGRKALETMVRIKELVWMKKSLSDKE